MTRKRWTRFAGAAAALLWLLLCLRWFDEGEPFRPGWLTAVPPVVLALACSALLVPWVLEGRGRASLPRELLLVVGAAVFFRLPLLVHGAAGYVTPDGALSGIVADHVRKGIDHLVFVPHVPYSGSLKSHLSAVVAMAMDTPRAFALVSVLFYALFVAAVFRLAQELDAAVPGAPVAAGLYTAFAPAFVTRYSLSNDGNYVEVLALGSWALVAAVSWARASETRPRIALIIGLLLGAAFWCHILAAIHVAAVGAFLLAVAWRRALRSLPAAAGGFTLGYAPGILWNLTHGWESFRYLVPGGEGISLEGGLAHRLAAMVLDQWPVLMGHDPGYPAAWNAILLGLAWLAVAAAVGAVVRTLLDARRRNSDVGRLLFVFIAVNLAVALFALPHVPGNPRYLLFLMAPLPVLLAHVLAGRRRPIMAGLVCFGAMTSLAQAPGTLRADARWRDFVGGLQAERVRWCYTDFYLATKINFLSEERIVCSAKLGPTTTEYFFAFREAVESAPEAAFVAVNGSQAEKLERRLARLGVSFERRELMKPVLFRLSRKVDPQELFPEQEFPLR